MAREAPTEEAPGRLILERLEPRQRETAPACSMACTVGGDVRGWISVIAQRRKLGLSDSEAYARAWSMIAAVNPFPATLGRICPHPCESACMRGPHDGAVAINALERFLGDWALRRHLPLPVLETRRQPESMAVIGAGPAGLSFAYQMARRGYHVTLYDKRRSPGGMLDYAVPSFRLPRDTLDAEVRRILDLAVEFVPDTAIGRDVSLVELRRRHSVLFVGIGAGHGVDLEIPGARGDGVWSGLEYLSAMKSAQPVDVGSQVIVIGGGNTALDAARVARRTGACVTIVYRRTRGEMRANATEIEAALSEGVRFEYLALPVRIERCDGSVTSVVVQHLPPAEAQASHRSRDPDERSEFVLVADCVISAIAQQPDWSDIEALQVPTRSAGSRLGGVHGILIYAGGDALKPGLAGFAIAHGRRSAESVHARLRGLDDPDRGAATGTAARCIVKCEYYASKERALVPSVAVHQRLAKADCEIEQTLSEQAFLDEVTRCFSCGRCFGCGQCFMYCSAGAFSRMDAPRPGAYFAFDPDLCEGCGKCIELCPCGFLTPAFAAHSI